MLKLKKYINSFYKIVFIIILYELIVGGSGRYFEIGPVTFRMIFYFLAIFLGVVYFIFKKKINIEIVLVLTSFTVLLFIGFIIGVINGSSLVAIFEDIKPLVFFYILIYFDVVINNFDDIKRIIKIIKIGSIFLSISYFMLLILLSNGVIDFITFYEEQKEAGEILFRNDLLFFYKGFLYLCIGFFFFLLSKSNKNKYFAAIIFIAILLTLTRGFIIFTFLITSYYILFLNRNFKIKAVFLILTIIITYNIIPYFTEALGDKSESDKIRIINF
ncbi:MAG: O-antigen polymerase, partial [Candidatus Kapaibacteriota bacterium]